MTAIRPGMPAPVQTPAQVAGGAGGAARAQQARALFFQTMQAQAGAAVQAPAQPQASIAPVATARATAVTPPAAPGIRTAAPSLQGEPVTPQDGPPRLRRPGSLLNILV